MSARSRLVLDALLFAALLAAFNPLWTGIAVHEWLSVAVIVPLLVHVIINWDWTLRVVGAFFDRLLHASRLNLLVDVVLFVSTVTVMLSGLLISQVIGTALGLSVSPAPVWVALHSVSADATIALLVVHLALHWRWVVSVSRRFVAVESTPSR